MARRYWCAVGRRYQYACCGRLASTPCQQAYANPRILLCAPPVSCRWLKLSCLRPPRRKHGYGRLAFMKALSRIRLTVLGIAIFSTSGVLLSPAAFAQSSISGSIKGHDGREASGAEIRVEREHTKAPAITALADAKGRFIVNNVPAGDYAIIARIGGGPTATQRVRLVSGRPISLKFNLRRSASTIASAENKKPKRYVWVPAPTGSHIGGGYEEVSDDSAASTSAKDPGAAIEKLQRSYAAPLQRSGNP